ncbi:alpha/beta hydrolase [Bacillus litorisediminis]|uniref:alpha/beta hydrolase n=1 Tax=Bacillus litorisediminis TaxID=2922713 RepID=UPI001FB00D94|nr:alpha/beta hydrolase [Bacillus litorisediminis]
MVNRKSYPLTNSKGRTIESALFTKDDKNHKLAILLPGAGYNTKMPIFYYATRLFLEMEYDVLHINYDFSGKEYEKLSNDEFFRCIKEDVFAGYDEVISDLHYQEFAVLGKSLGTIAMASLFDEKKELGQAKAIWLTPLIHNHFVFEHMINTAQKSFAVIGTNDFCFREERWREIKEKANYDTLLLDQADHSLDKKGDVLSSIEALKTTMEQIKRFVSE